MLRGEECGLVGGKRRRADEHVVQQASQRVEVAAQSSAPRPERSSGEAQGMLPNPSPVIVSQGSTVGEHLDQTEVEDLDGPVPPDHDVLGLEVPVHEPGGVRRGQAGTELSGHETAEGTSNLSPSCGSKRYSRVVPSTNCITRQQVSSVYDASYTDEMLG
ncbi:hypothetical protein OM788_003029 [Streptomyces sp. KA12]|uniref:hypothetical protein n=1 Tax=Streptomyces sp. KA12 TaxID=2991730 RepID=UPI0023AE9879|nr:hypothetical protein [Streptomyces sp. KA12]MDF0373159.1 hypothetical protein [Streptomyces sp. KA12]